MFSESRSHATLASVGSAFLQRRPWLVAPAFAAQGSILYFSNAPRQQVKMLLLGFSVMMLFFAWEGIVRRNTPVSPRGFLVSLLITLTGISLGTFVTGALASPMVALIFAPVIVGFAAFGRSMPSKILLYAMVMVLLGFALVPEGVPFGLLQRSTHRWMVLVASMTSLQLLWLGVTSLTDAHARTTTALTRANDEFLAIAQARSRTMESLGQRVAHEIKNPLTAIKGLADVMAERAEQTGDRRRLEVLSGEVVRIESILRDYLSFSRPLEEIVRTSTDLAQVLHPLGSLLEARAETLGITLTTTGESLIANLDGNRVKEAVLNLALNALEATPRGGAVHISWLRDDNEILVRVQDNGRGMTAESLLRVGEAFYTTREGGTGLGVRLARGVAQAHGGSLRFDSTPSVGTTAYLSLGRL
jgi:signal transduction histidine kinase